MQSFSLDYGLLYLRPAIEERYIEGYLERIRDVDPEEEMILRDLWDDETQREVVIDCLKADCEVRTERPGSSKTMSTHVPIRYAAPLMPVSAFRYCCPRFLKFS